MGYIQKLVIHTDKCIGCRACTSSCPPAMITLSDSDETRTIRFPVTCTEDCTRCAKVCSEDAITLEAAAEPVEGFSSVEFPLVNCEECDKPFASAPMIEKVRRSTSASLDPVSPYWIDSCPNCRQAGTAVQQVGKKKAVA